MRISPYYPAFWLDRIALAYLSTGRYQEAIEACELMLDRSRKGEVNPFFAHLYLAEAYAGLGQIDKAKAQAKEVVKIKPNFSLEGEKLLAAYKDPAHKEHHFACTAQGRAQLRIGSSCTFSSVIVSLGSYRKVSSCVFNKSRGLT